MTVIGHGTVICTSSTRPTSPIFGQTIYETDTNKLVLYNQNGWEYANNAGQVAYFARSTAPIGWLKANGAAISRTTYADLFNAIGTNYGSGDGSTTFNLPDYRGEFLRCWSDGSSVDSGRALHSYQAHDWKGFYNYNTGRNTYSYTHDASYMGKGIYGVNGWSGNIFTGYWAAPAATLGALWDSSEIRPRNRALLACIKY